MGSILTKLGYHSQADVNAFSECLRASWLTSYTREDFVDLPKDELTNIAGTFLTNQGRNFWGERRVGGPLWPESEQDQKRMKELLTPSVVGILEAQQQRHRNRGTKRRRSFEDYLQSPVRTVQNTACKYFFTFRQPSMI